MAEAATRGALQGLRDEERAMQEGYELLDQKRILLVQEIKRQLAEYDTQQPAFSARYQEAVARLRQAACRHGVAGLEAYPHLPWQGAPAPVIKRRNLMGVYLQTASLAIEAGALPDPDNPSPEADAAARLFLQVVSQATALAALETNLHKLLHEYRRTERRARALEEILLPELRQRINTLVAHLEDIDQEEALRVIGHKAGAPS